MKVYEEGRGPLLFLPNILKGCAPLRRAWPELSDDVQVIIVVKHFANKKNFEENNSTFLPMYFLHVFTYKYWISFI